MQIKLVYITYSESERRVTQSERSVDVSQCGKGQGCRILSFEDINRSFCVFCLTVIYCVLYQVDSILAQRI